MKELDKWKDKEFEEWNWDDIYLLGTEKGWQGALEWVLTNVNDIGYYGEAISADIIRKELNSESDLEAFKDTKEEKYMGDHVYTGAKLGWKAALKWVKNKMDEGFLLGLEDIIDKELNEQPTTKKNL